MEDLPKFFGFGLQYAESAEKDHCHTHHHYKQDFKIALLNWGRWSFYTCLFFLKFSPAFFVNS